MSNKRILSCSITGAIHSPTMSDYLPYKTEDIAQQAIDAGNAGATVVHIHARDPENGRPTPDLEVYDKILSRIRQANKEVLICVTTGGGIGQTIDQRLAVVPKFKPQLCSMNSGSLNWGLYTLAARYEKWKFDWEKPMYESTRDWIFKNTFADMERMLTVMAENGVKPELECYDVGHIYNLKTLQTQGLLKGRPYMQFVLGINGGVGAEVYDLVNMKTTADRLFGVDGYEWSAFGAGKQEYPVCVTNLFLGGHVRVGLEDNLYLAKGVHAKSNAELVTKMVRLMKDLDFELATPQEGRQILGLSN